MSPKMVVTKDGVRYPRDFAEQHGIEVDREVETPSAADRTHTHAGIGVATVQDDVNGTVVTSANGVNQGLAAPVTDPALAEAKAAEEAGKGALGTTGAPDNTTAGGTTGETTTNEDGAGDGGAAGGTEGLGDADGTAGAGSTSRARRAASK